jgi:two-component system LytT family response regulator
MKAVIIDDLSEAREALKQDIKEYTPQIEILGEADGVLSGAKLVKEQKPDILFLDIQMNDGDGFDLLDIIDREKYKVIFTTSSDSYAIKAFKFSAVDYLLKPIDPDELVSAVEKIDASTVKDENMDVLMETLKSSNRPKRVVLVTQDRIFVKDIEEIVRCESNINYTWFYLLDGSKILVSKTLKEYDKMLSDHNFYRVHQSHLINATYIKEYVKSDGGYLLMKDGSSVPVSTRRKQEVMDMLSNL